MQSKAQTVKEYLAALPPDRRAVISAVRKVVRDNLDKGYSEGMQYGSIGYFVPHSVYPPGYHCDPNQPLPFAGLASQKNYMSLYLMCLYGEGDLWKWFHEAWAKTGKKLDMGKCCLRFKKLDDLALDVIGELIRRVPAARHIAYYESAVTVRGRKSAASKSTDACKPKPGKPPAKPPKMRAAKVVKRASVKKSPPK